MTQLDLILKVCSVLNTGALAFPGLSGHDVDSDLNGQFALVNQHSASLSANPTRQFYFRL